MIIYLITNKINGKQYVGQTIQPIEERWRQHCKDNSNVSLLKYSIRKHGKDNFSIDILYKAESIEDLNEKEEKFINQFNTLSPNGYNLLPGGLNKKFSEESKKKMSDSHKGSIPWNKGLTVEDPRILALSIKSAQAQMGRVPWNKGLTSSDDARLEKQKRYGESHHNFGKSISEEHKNSLFAGLEKNLEKTRIKVFCHQNNTTYKSISEASVSLGISASFISGVISGKYKKSKGYTFSKVL